jgi:uncharacterized protein (TIGR02284 family)
MEHQSETIETLNDLIMINNDRIAGYEKVYDETNEIETDLRALFKRMADESRENVSALIAEVEKLGGEPASGTMASGKLYRLWMDIRATFSTDNRMAVLSNAEAGEDAAQKAYAEALASETLPADIITLITAQKVRLLASHENIKNQRDMQKDVGKYPLTT